MSSNIAMDNMLNDDEKKKEAELSQPVIETSEDKEADDEMNIFEYAYDNIVEISQATKTFLLKIFTVNVFYILLFPMSEIARLVYTRKFAVTTLAWGVSVTAILTWIFIGLFVTTEHTKLYDAELKIPIVLLVVLSVDTALALSNVSLTAKAKLIEEFQKVFKKAQAEAATKKRHYSAYLRSLSQVITIMPAESEVRQARELLQSMKVTIPFAEEVTFDVIDSFTTLSYDIALEKALGVESSRSAPNNNVSVSPSADEADKVFGSHHEEVKRDLENAGVRTFDLGESYRRQYMEHKSVRLENLADQIIWGLRKEVMGCNGVCERFWRIDKVPSVLAAIGMVAFFALLPTMFRFYDDNLDGFTRVEHTLSALYFIITIALSLQIGVFFVTIIDVFKLEWQRFSVLTALMNPGDAAARGLPKFDFTDRSNIMAWLALRQYITAFSHTNIVFFGQRLLVYSLGVLGSMAYLATLHTNGKLSSEAVFTSFVIVFFLACLVFFLMILAFGSMTNAQMTEHRNQIASKIMILHERKFRMNESGASAIKEDDNIRLLYDLSTFLSHQPLVTLLGIELTPAIAGTIATGLVAVGGSVMPILANAFGADLA